MRAFRLPRQPIRKCIIIYYVRTVSPQFITQYIRSPSVLTKSVSSERLRAYVYYTRVRYYINKSRARYGLFNIFRSRHDCRRVVVRRSIYTESVTCAVPQQIPLPGRVRIIREHVFFPPSI